jgi:hypothetical protein
MILEMHCRFWEHGSTRRVGMVMAVLLAGAVALQLGLNALRFGSVADFGTAHLDRQMPGGPTYSLRYVARNLWTYLGAPVTYALTPPLVRASAEGNALWSYQFGVLVPVLALAALGRQGGPRAARGGDTAARTRLLVVGCVALWSVYFVYLLLYRFTGAITFGGRYLLDTQPFLLLVIVISYACVRRDAALRLVAVACLLLSGFVQIVSPRMLH